MAILKKLTLVGLSFNDWVETLSADRQAAFKEANDANRVLYADLAANVTRSNIGTIFSDEITYNAYHSIENVLAWQEFYSEW